MIGNGADKYMFISGHFRVLGMRKTRKYILCVAVRKLERKERKASHCGSKQQKRSPDEITLLLLVRSTYICVSLRAHTIRIFNTTPTEIMQQHPLLFAMNRTYLFL